eukprot:Hpha_TRINITY_DN9759_c0_g1::TRINITY_DN9759_c0_g1_i1::g.10366::m.10366
MRPRSGEFVVSATVNNVLLGGSRSGEFVVIAKATKEIASTTNSEITRLRSGEFITPRVGLRRPSGSPYCRRWACMCRHRRWWTFTMPFPLPFTPTSVPHR